MLLDRKTCDSPEVRDAYTIVYFLQGLSERLVFFYMFQVYIVTVLVILQAKD